MLTPSPSSQVKGIVEEILPGRVKGWCYDQGRPNDAVGFIVKSDGRQIADGIASTFRSDLLKAKIGNGFHAFSFTNKLIDPRKNIEVLSADSLEPFPILSNAITRVLSIDEFDTEAIDLSVIDQFSPDLFKRCASFHLFEDLQELPDDPFSDEYRDRQISLYRNISGKDGSYNPWKSEPISIVVEHSLDPHPFPFSTGDTDFIGCHFIALGHILRAIKAAHPGPGARVLEYGCGTGFTTIFLAASKLDMTAVDINSEALQVVDRLAQARKLSVTTFNGEFGQAPDETKKFDVILFYEAFHHCLDFVNVLKTLHGRLVSGGSIIFAGEPITEDFPKPWGIRMDGHAAWAIRKVAWLEMGFNEKFFCDLLRSLDFEVSKQTFEISPPIFVARKA
jgi:SAM-dependent methyltransferase